MSTKHQSKGETSPFNLWRAVSAWSSARLNPTGELPGLYARFNSWQPSPRSSLYYNEKEKHWDRQTRAGSLVILSTSWPWGGLEDLSSPAPSSVAMGYHLSARSAAARETLRNFPPLSRETRRWSPSPAHSCPKPRGTGEAAGAGATGERGPRVLTLPGSHRHRGTSCDQPWLVPEERRDLTAPAASWHPSQAQNTHSANSGKASWPSLCKTLPKFTYACDGLPSRTTTEHF